jgi:hypothetical protein
LCLFQLPMSWSFCVQLRIRWEAIVLLNIGVIDDHLCLNFLFIPHEYIFSSHMLGIAITWRLSSSSSVNCCKLSLISKEYDIPNTCDTHLLTMSRPLYELCIWFVPHKWTPFRGLWGVLIPIPRDLEFGIENTRNFIEIHKKCTLMNWLNPNHTWSINDECLYFDWLYTPKICIYNIYVMRILNVAIIPLFL